ncbi:hypothetical protein FBUS_10624 [Fasciolopsis buskii]|uniref:G-protein coupled receptors family 1 profile domain-containing protein n=1 Tax=Fasciolopsis buskii TaxID=27845 RepID=A0A8E0S1C6_9TREM|nr:hypothetical protein FBUS_10624 [Fasciolopsis buski]
MGTREEEQLTILKHFFMCFTVAVGLTANVTGLFAIPNMKINFPATRLLLSTQFSTDILGCLVSFAYWTSFNVKIPPELLNGSAFSYLWTSYCLCGVVGQISSQNMMLLSIDRYWAVVGFRTYPRNSKFYRFGSVIISGVIAVVLFLPLAIISYYRTHLELIGLNTLIACMRFQALLMLLAGFIIPGLVISALQIRILLMLWRMRRTPRTIAPTGSTEESTERNSLNQSMKGISLGIAFMLVVFITARSTHFFLYILKAFTMNQLLPVEEWKTDGVFSFSTTFCLNPIVMIFTSPAARKWLFDKFVVPILRCFYLTSRNAASK